ncbi:Pyrrolo-quinoline quinone [Paenibacillus curdlanolyticus YK9]|uniref:Pyrrolo-quinoline quinone n=1 Tax=Paenibacillus curdlanolyticus YK9 TaxID=717606 RepID=E0I5U0_9BACL|nr:PQQ-binding-like beta-propeller repeat protein [Paenibacillus curdlanolyticus]EFM12332.1 Pyrrolo-quinoline quinone [Paenibacillus curdlanolyticus YK9]
MTPFRKRHVIGKKIALGVGAFLVVLSSGAAWSPQISKAETAVVSVGSGSYELTAPFVKSSWTLSVDNWDSQNQAVRRTDVLAEEGRVYAIVSGGQLTAVDAATGKKVWKTSLSLKHQLAYVPGVIYSVTGDGRLIALNSANGKPNWTSKAKTDGALKIVPVGDTVYVTNNLQFYAFDARTGALRWQVEETDTSYLWGSDELLLADGVIIRGYLVQGALSANQINAYDAKSGALLWSKFRQNVPIAAKSGLLYSEPGMNPMGDFEESQRQFNLDVINARTGEIKGSRVYKWETASPSNGGVYGNPMLIGNDLYIYEGDKLAKYDFNAYVPSGGKPLRTWSIPRSGESTLLGLNRIHRGRILLHDYHNNAIVAIKETNGQQIGWLTDNPAAQLDIYGNGLYVGQTDGVWHAYNFDTTKALFSFRSASRYFGPTLKSKDMIIIQNKGLLQAVKLPQQLQ